MTDDIETVIKHALKEMEKARNDAAKPLTFTTEAAEASDERSRGQFRANLPTITGGFPVVREGLLEASALFGKLAKELTLFENPAAKEIPKERAMFAREISEHACKVRVARKLRKDPNDVKPKDGIPCAKA